MQRLDPHVAALLDAVAPAPLDVVGDWEGVLRDAGRRRPQRRWLVALPVATAVAVIVLAGLTWPFGSSRVDVLSRARAALGYGPVVHVVFQGRRYGEFVDLRTGAQTALYERHELWFDPRRGLHELDSVDAGAPGSGVPQSEDWEIPAALSADQASVFQGFATGYRQALDSGEARVIGRGEVDGRSVYWIRFVPVPVYYRLFKNSYEVAVDSDSFAPLLVRKTGNSYPYGPEDPRNARDERVLVVESAPAGAGQLDRVEEISERGDKEIGGGFERVGPQTLANALREVPDAVWLGRSFRGLPLAETRVELSELFVPGQVERVLRRAKVVTLGYRGARGIRGFVQVTSSTAPFGAGWLVPPLTVRPLVPPPGKMLVIGRSGALLRVGRVYVGLEATPGAESVRTLLALARALTPIPH